MELSESNHCCGIGELNEVHGLVKRGLEKEVLGLMDGEGYKDGYKDGWFENGEYSGFAYIFFSVTEDFLSDGDALMEFIQKHKLGEVKKMRARLNSNTDNKLTMYCWGINKRNCFRFYTTHGKNENDFEDED